MIAVLFARRDSVYKSLPECDVWDEDRDARRWPGGCHVIAHPPCRSWGGLRHLAKAPPGEHELTVFALEQVRTWGGVLEHPRRSILWPEFRLPLGDQIDEYGGFSLLVNQCWWGHKAEKPSLLYVCRVEPAALPAVTVHLRAPRHIVGASSRRWRPDVSKRLREATPPDFARWLVAVAGAARPCSTSGTATVPIDQHGAVLRAPWADTARVSL